MPFERIKELPEHGTVCRLFIDIVQEDGEDLPSMVIGNPDKIPIDRAVCMLAEAIGHFIALRNAGIPGVD